MSSSSSGIHLVSLHDSDPNPKFIKQYYGRHKESGKSKATVISDGQVILLDIRGGRYGGGGGGGGSNLMSQ